MITKNKLPLESEHVMQRKVFEWSKLHEHLYPDLKLLFAVPNAGKRSRFERGFALEEGLKKGVPDIWLPVAKLGPPRRGGKTEVLARGLVIEMKRRPNALTPEQGWWLDSMRDQHWQTNVCWSFEEAVGVIEEYLKK